MNSLTPELVAKAKAAKSAEELFELAKANNVELTEMEAGTYFAQLEVNITLADTELDSVSGGFGCGSDNDSESDARSSNLNMNTDSEKNNSKFA